MKKQVTLFLLGMALLGGTSCESLNGEGSGETVVEGQIVDRLSGQPVADAYVQLYQPGKGFSSGYSKVGEPYRTDANGNFSFQYEAAGDGAYKILAHSEKGYYTRWDDAPDIATGRNNKGLKVKAQPPAWVKIKLIDELPKSRVWISIWGYSGQGDDFSLPEDTVFYRPAAAGFPDRVSWDLVSNENPAPGIRYFQDLTVSGFDTATVEIKF